MYNTDLCTEAMLGPNSNSESAMMSRLSSVMAVLDVELQIAVSLVMTLRATAPPILGCDLSTSGMTLFSPMLEMSLSCSLPLCSFSMLASRLSIICSAIPPNSGTTAFNDKESNTRKLRLPNFFFAVKS